MLEPERLAGGVWGHLIGDAMGVPYEFREPSAIGEVRWGAWSERNVAPGTWSDDGSLMLALLDTVLPDPMAVPARGWTWDLGAQAQAFVSWFRDGAYTPENEGRFDVGIATSHALHAIERGTAATQSGGDEQTLGNGALMRTIAVALAGRELSPAELVARAEDSGAITHASMLSRATCALYALICRALLSSESRRHARTSATDQLQAIYAAPGREASAQALSAVLDWPNTNTPSGTGHVVNSFWSAWTAFSGASNYRETIERAIGYGHDTDTTACIAGGMAGIHWGLDGIPAEWLEGMRGRDVVQPILDRLVETADWSTSSGNPLRVKWIENGPADWTGRLGLTMLPGKKNEGTRNRRHWRDERSDVDALRAAGVQRLVLLIEDDEFGIQRVRGLPELLSAAAIELERFPIVDMNVPADLAAFGQVLERVTGWLREGCAVAIACVGGCGRTGAVAACLLASAGVSADDAIALVRRTRSCAIERLTQEDFVRQWAKSGGAAAKGA